MLILAISFVTTTYAWLSLATVNSISNIELSAVDSYDLMLSLDGENYYNTLPSELILESIRDLKFNDLTSQDGLTFSKLRQGEKEAIANKDYLSITFYLRTTNRRYTEIHLANHKTNVDFNEETDGTFITSKGQYFKSEYDFLFSEDELIKAGTINKYYASDAMRVSFMSDSLNEAKIFDLSGNSERGYGYPYGANAYFEAKEGIILEPPIAPHTIYEMSEFNVNTPTAANDTSYLVSLLSDNEGYFVGSLTVNIWLEGWDGDAFDAIYKDILKIQFEFKAVMPNELFE